MLQARATWTPYCGSAPGPGSWLGQWNFDVYLIGAIGLALAAGYLRSPATMRRQWGAALVAGVLFVSPLCALGSALFTARVAHHLVLSLVLAPLLLAAAGRSLRGPRLSLAMLTALQAIVFWAWHAPPLYEAATGSDAMFWAMQLSITGSAMAWWAALRRASPLAAAASLLASMVQMGVLGALIVFAGRPLYAPHWLSSTRWGLSPLEDQQIAGLVMWVGGSGVYLLLASALLYRALGASPAARTA